jgi:hypothetical protein
MAAHVCPDCQLLHDMPSAPEESDEVKIARINREADIRIAQLSARQDRDWNETRVEVAEIEAGAEVESAVAEAEIIGAALEASDVPEAEPIEIIAPDMVQDVDVDLEEELPPTEGSPVPSESKPHGLGMW